MWQRVFLCMCVIAVVDLQCLRRAVRVRLRLRVCVYVRARVRSATHLNTLSCLGAGQLREGVQGPAQSQRRWLHICGQACQGGLHAPGAQARAGQGV